MNDQQTRQAHAIAFLASTSRPTGAPRWDPEGIYTHVARLFERGLSVYEVATRTLTHAQDPKAATPGVIAVPPKHTPEVNRAQRPPKRDDECRAHPGQWAGNCGGCAADRLAGDDQPAQPRGGTPRPTNVSQHVAALRQAIRGATP